MVRQVVATAVEHHVIDAVALDKDYEHCGIAQAFLGAPVAQRQLERAADRGVVDSHRACSGSFRFSA